MYHPNLSWFALTDDLVYYEDPGHGWIAVPLSRYPDAESLASSFSVFVASGDRRWVLIEEDVDAGRFFRSHPEIDVATLRSERLSDADGEILRRLPRGNEQ